MLADSPNKMEFNMKRAIVYIDGFNIYHGICELNKPHLKWLDMEILATSILKSGTSLQQVKYFTAMVHGDSEKLKRQKTYHQAIQLMGDKVHITKGQFYKKSVRCDKCDQVKLSYEEKRTDVNIACEMLQDAYENRFDVAFLVSGDSDLVAPVEKVRTKGKAIIVIFPPNRWGRHLNAEASGSFTLEARHLEKCLLPPQIPTGKGWLKIPAEWT